jgi:hypothetical protein
VKIIEGFGATGVPIWRDAGESLLFSSVGESRGEEKERR